VLANPEGTRHLAFDPQQGTWSRIFADGSSQFLRASEAVLLRPSDADTIIKWCMMWCLNERPDIGRADEVIDDLAVGVKTAIGYLASQAGHR
jgi:hypothetical protein